jgi:hypothetical protein
VSVAVSPQLAPWAHYYRRSRILKIGGLEVATSMHCTAGTVYFFAGAAAAGLAGAAAAGLTVTAGVPGVGFEAAASGAAGLPK